MSFIISMQSRRENPCTCWPYAHVVNLFKLALLQRCSVITLAPPANLFIALVIVALSSGYCRVAGVMHHALNGWVAHV